jgi:hypothetical protein
MQKHDVSANDIASTIMGGLLIGLVCCWPWFMAYSKTQDPKRQLAVLVFSAISALAAILMFKPISTAPTEGSATTSSSMF